MTLVAGIDPSGPSAGGTRAYVESIAGILSSRGVPHLVVAAGPAPDARTDWVALAVRKKGSSVHFLAALAASMPSIPIPKDTVVHAQRPDALLPFALGNDRRARICTLHGNPADGIREKGGPMAMGAYAGIERFVFRRVRRLIAVDSGTATEYRRRYPWLAGRMATIPNGVDTTLFRPMDNVAAKREWGFAGTVFLYAGRRGPEKRLDDIVAAFRSLGAPDASLVIASEGERKVVETPNGSRIHFLGSVLRTQMPSLLNATDAAVLFSVREGLPAFVLESLACGIPVIATPVGDIPALVMPGVTGCLVSTLNELRAAMESVLRGDLGPNQVISRVVERYDWSHVGASLLRTYEEVWRDRAA